MVMYCPVCKQERNFVRVVEAHQETHIPDNPIIGPGGRGQICHYIVTTELPMAYCSECKSVIYVGPSAAKVKKDFEEKRKRQEIEDTKITIPPGFEKLMEKNY